MPRRKRSDKHRLTLDEILEENRSFRPDGSPGDVIDLLIYGPLLDTSGEEEAAMLEAYDDELAWEVRRRMKQYSREGPPWIADRRTRLQIPRTGGRIENT